MEADTTRSDVAPGQAIIPWRMASFPSISQLPTELLIGIFQLSLFEIELKSRFAADDSRRNVEILYVMRAVTKQWQDIIEGTPCFWTTLVSILPRHVNEASILRSSNLPLIIIVYHAAFKDGARNREPDTEFLNLIQHTRSRWCALVLGLYHPRCMSDYLEAPTPLLQKIIVRSRQKLQLQGGERNHLRFVYLSNASILWPSGQYSQLKSLTLKNVPSNSMSGVELLDTLRASPGLEVLKLVGITASIPPPSSTITLHQLKCIKLNYCAMDFVQSVLQQIRAPSCTRLWLCMGSGRGQEVDVPHFLKEAFESFHGTLRTIHQQFGGSEVLLDCDTSDWHTPTYSEMEGFSISIDSLLDPFCFRWIDSILQNQPGLQFIFGEGSTSSEAVLRNVAPMRSVTSVFIRDSSLGTDVRAALQFIGRPLPTSTSLPSLPYLEELFLPPQGWDTSNLLEMVQSRFCALLWENMERTLLTIKINRGRFSWGSTPGALLDLAKIRYTNGVQSVIFVGRKDLDGMLSVVWDEEGSEVV